MSALNQAFIKMLQTLKLMVNANLSKFTVIPAFEAAFTEVTDLLTEMEALELVAVETTGTTTDAKDQAFEELMDALLEATLPVSAYAGKIKDVVLKGLMDVKTYKLDRMSSQEVVSICTNIHTAADAVKTEALPYGLTPAKLATLATKIDDYSKRVPEIRQLQGEINTSKRDINRLKAEAEELLEQQLDPMVEGLWFSDSTAVELWRSARHVVKPPRIVTQLKVRVFAPEGEVEMPLPDVPVFAVNGKTYSATTDAEGEAHWKPLPYGFYYIECEVPGFQPFLLRDFKVVRGKINHVEARLVRVEE